MELDEKTKHILQGMQGSIEETTSLVKDEERNVLKAKGVVAGLMLAATSVEAQVARIATEAKAKEEKGEYGAGDMTLIKREIAGINGAHAVILKLLQENQREQRIAEGRMDGYHRILQKMQARVKDEQAKFERRQAEILEANGKERPEPVRVALGRDKLQEQEIPAPEKITVEKPKRKKK